MGKTLLDPSQFTEIHQLQDDETGMFGNMAELFDELRPVLAQAGTELLSPRPEVIGRILEQSASN